MNKLPARLFATLSLCAVAGATAQNAPLPTAQLRVGAQVIKAEVAKTEFQREQGMMFRDELLDNAGMVLVFEHSAAQCIWMKNTLIPLSVAFVESNGKIVNIEEMQAQTLDSHCSAKSVPVLYALEMNSGWFKQKNIKPGMTIGNLPPAK